MRLLIAVPSPASVVMTPCQRSRKLSRLFAWQLNNHYIINMANDNQRGGSRPGSGRPAIDPGQESVPVQIRMTTTQRDKLKRLGGPHWVRDRIDKAKEPPKKE